MKCVNPRCVSKTLFLFGASCVSIVELPNFPVIITIMIITSFEAKIVVGRRVTGVCLGSVFSSISVETWNNVSFDTGSRPELIY